MQQNMWLTLLLVFLVVVGLTMAIFWYSSRTTVRARIQAMTKRVIDTTLDEAQAEETAPARDRFMEAFEDAEPLREPDGGWQTSPVRQRLLQAGLYRPSMPAVFFLAKIALSVLLCVGSFLFMEVLTQDIATLRVVLIALIMAAVGYLLPDALLARMVRRRQDTIRRGLPEAADFLVVCVEAGQSLDSAFVRVAREMRLSCPELAREMHWVTLEFRAGRPRAEALDNLSARTGVEDVETLASMLNQADRFGTSTSDALRVYADMLRVKRRQEAQETAAKIPVKLLFPLIFFIFPSLVVVLAGPAMIQIFRVLMPTMGK